MEEERACIMVALAALALAAQPLPNEEYVFQALNAVDALQTVYCMKEVEGCREINPLLGKHPSAGAIIAFKIANGALHLAVTRALQKHHPEWVKPWQILSISVQGGVVAANFRVVF